MKKLIFGLALALISFATQAQEFKEYFLTSTYNGRQIDTVAQSGVRLQASPSVPQFYNSVGVGVQTTRISGTAGGVIRLLGSYDGVNFFRILPTDSLVVSNSTVTNYKSFILNAYHYKHIAVQYSGNTGAAQSVTLRSRVLFKRGKQ